MAKYIDQQGDFDELLRLINDCTIVVDTEFVRRSTYFSILSLIQVLFDDKVYIIDCLKIDNLQKFSDILTDISVKKIFHCAYQDLQIFKKDFGVEIVNFEDTQILSNFCGYDSNIGYSSLAAKILNVNIDKSQQNSNWLHRPLSFKQLEYAAKDVVYPKKIYEILIKKVAQKGLEENYQEDKKALIYQLNNQYESLFYSFVKKYQKVINKRKVDRSLIRDALLLRDEISQKINIPRRSLVSDEVMLEILIDNKNVAALEEVDELFTEGWQEILSKYNNSLDLEVKSCNNFNGDIFQRAKTILKNKAAEIDIDQTFIVSTFDFREFLFTDNFSKNITKWRMNILSKIKQEVGL